MPICTHPALFYYVIKKHNLDEDHTGFLLGRQLGLPSPFALDERGGRGPEGVGPFEVGQQRGRVLCHLDLVLLAQRVAPRRVQQHVQQQEAHLRRHTRAVKVHTHGRG